MRSSLGAAAHLVVAAGCSVAACSSASVSPTHDAGHGAAKDAAVDAGPRDGGRDAGSEHDSGDAADAAAVVRAFPAPVVAGTPSTDVVANAGATCGQGAACSRPTA